MIDASGWSNPRGEGRFLRGVAGELADRAGEGAGRVVLICSEPDRADLSHLESVPGVSTTALPSGVESGGKLASGSRRRLVDLVALARTVRGARGRGPALLLQPSLVGWFPVPGVGQLVVAHDVKPARGPVAEALFPGRHDRVLAIRKQRAALRTAAGVLAVSGSTAAACAASGTPAEALPPTPVAAAFRPRGRAEQIEARAGVGLGPDDPFLLIASGLNRHKDPALALAALAKIVAKPSAVGLERPPVVVMAGSERGAYDGIGAELRAEAVRLGLEDLVRFPGHLSDDALAALYSSAAAAVSASSLEGIGLAALEARACGCRAVLSDIPAHRETSARWASFFDPGSRDGLVAALGEALAQPGPEPVADYSWAAVAGAVFDRALAMLSPRERARSWSGAVR